MRQRRRVSIKPSTLCPPSAHSINTRTHTRSRLRAHALPRPPLSCRLPLVFALCLAASSLPLLLPSFISTSHTLRAPSSFFHSSNSPLVSAASSASSSPHLFRAWRVITPQSCLALKNHICLLLIHVPALFFFFFFFLKLKTL